VKNGGQVWGDEQGCQQAGAVERGEAVQCIRGAVNAKGKLGCPETTKRTYKGEGGKN